MRQRDVAVKDQAERVSESSTVIEPNPDRHVIPTQRWFMAVSLLVLNVIDVYLTKAIIRLGGSEANPIMAPIMDHAALPILLKTVVSLGVGALLLASPIRSKFADRAVGLVLVGYVIVMGWNLGILLQASMPNRFG